LNHFELIKKIGSTEHIKHDKHGKRKKKVSVN
jgi:hypothetical protein